MAGDIELVGDRLARVGQAATHRALDDALDDALDHALDHALRGRSDRLAAEVRKQPPETLAWLAAVRGLQQMNRTGAYRVMFFINMAPDICSREDRFHNGGSLDDDDALREILGDGTPVASSTRAFLRYRPSQMPGANNHSFGNANRVKADALFEFLRTSTLLPPAH